VIDNDQGESGASASWREGFQRLVTDVGMGHAGIVMGLEVSRLPETMPTGIDFWRSAAPMEPKSCELVNAAIGYPAFRTLTRAISAGSSFSRTSRSLRATAEGTRSHAPRCPEKERRYCKAAQCAVDAADTYAPDTPHDAAGWRPGTCVTVRMAVVVSRTASRSREGPSTKRSAR
jgi:hypothetical protein